MRRFLTGFFVLLLLGLFSSQGVAASWYVRAGAGLDWSRDADFSDQDCASTSPAALFGCGAGIDGRPRGAYGDFGSIPVLEIAGGLYPAKWLRTDLSVTYRPSISYEGEANFLAVPGEQPVTGEGESVSFMLNVFLELKEVLHLDLGRFSPYLGGGAGLAHNHIGKMTYQFPGLTRHKISITPSGSETDFAYMVAVGTGVRLSRSLVLDLSYRYSDLGRIRTESGNMYLDSLPGGIDIGETSAPLRTHGFMVGLRYNFGD